MHSPQFSAENEMSKYCAEYVEPFLAC